MAIKVVTQGASSARVVNEELWFTDPRIGGVMGSADDQLARLQAWIALAASAQTNASARLPPGRVVVSSDGNLTLAGLPRPIKIAGCGTGDQSSTGAVSAIKWNIDRGANKYALSLDTGYAPQIEDIALVGPGTNTAIGTPPCNMDGVEVTGRMQMRNVLITKFNAACGVLNDHHRWIMCDFRGNGSALDFKANPTGGIGDEFIFNCHLEDQRQASIKIHSDAAITFLQIHQGHLGMAPYAIWRYGSVGGSRPYFLYSAKFHGVSFENCQNGDILDEPGDGAIREVHFLPMGSSGTGANGGFRWAAMPARAAIDVGQVTNCYWEDQPPLWVNSTYPAIRAQNVNGVRIHPQLNAMLGVLTNDTARVFELVDGPLNTGLDLQNIWMGCTPGTPGGTAVSCREAAGTITKYDLVEETSYAKVQQASNGAGSRTIGVALHNAVAGEAAHFLIQGQTSACKVTNKTGATILNGALLKPDSANAGGVTTATSMADGYVIGRALENITSGGGQGRADIKVL